MSEKQKTIGFEKKDIDRVVAQATKLGLGLAIISKEALEKTIKSVSRKNKVSERDAKSAVGKLVASSKAKEKQLERKIKNAISKAKAKSPVVAKKEADKLKAEVAKLKNQLKKKRK